MSGVVRLCSSMTRLAVNQITSRTPYVIPNKVTSTETLTQFATRNMASLRAQHLRGGPPKTYRSKTKALDGHPYKKGIVLKTLIRKPKKPNSANRKCVRVKLSNKKEVLAFIPGEGHNLQEHHIVLVKGGTVKDLPGVKHAVVRGKYDCAHIVSKKGQAV